MALGEHTHTHAHTNTNICDIAPTPTHNAVSVPAPHTFQQKRGLQCIGICLRCPIFCPSYPAFSSAPLPVCLAVCLHCSSLTLCVSRPSLPLSPFISHLDKAVKRVNFQGEVSDRMTVCGTRIKNESFPWLHMTEKSPYMG